MAQQQALLLAHIDAESAQLLLNRSTTAQTELGVAVKAYFASIAEETTLMGDDASDLGYQAREEANARHLLQLLQSGPGALPAIR